MTERVFILGAGRAGRGLARALRASGTSVVGLHGTRASGDEGGITAGAIPETAGEAGIVIVAVQDAQLEKALDELASAPIRPGAVVLHASGSSDPAGLDALRAAGHPGGTFHPLVSLADPDRAAELLAQAWIGIDGDPPAREAALALADRLGARVLEIPAGQKERYHAAAVFAANFPTILAAISIRLLREAGISEREGWAALRGLMAATVSNLQHGDPRTTLTGPIVRGDADTVMRHLGALASDPFALDAYVALSRAALPLAEQTGTSADLLREIDLLLGGAEG
ncbi:MAG TPA: Rossmann-like and DUF2520 domain-containing protein [Gemmatimonadaceae bacterium]|nr:Rossmann-like and DUF2520 domain-containing protein [Gemmatimonadaceae bacterium]